MQALCGAYPDLLGGRAFTMINHGSMQTVEALRQLLIFYFSSPFSALFKRQSEYLFKKTLFRLPGLQLEQHCKHLQLICLLFRLPGLQLEQHCKHLELICLLFRLPGLQLEQQCKHLELICLLFRLPGLQLEQHCKHLEGKLDQV